MESVTYSRPAGVRDVDADTLRLRHQIEAGLLRVFASYGFTQVQVPTIEYRDLYGPDRIGYELYHHLVMGRLAESRDFPAGGLATPPSQAPEPVNDVVLRPDFTTPLARMFAERVLHHDGRVPEDAPYRWSYAGQVFRDWPPRTARLREFRQVGAELLGSASLRADAEILQLACDAAVSTGLRRWRLLVGHAALYRALLQHAGVPDHAVRAVANGLAQLARVRLAAQDDDAAFARFLEGSHNRLRDLHVERARQERGDQRAARAAVFGTTPELADLGRLSLADWRTRLPALYERWFSETWQGRGLSADSLDTTWRLAHPAPGTAALESLSRDARPLAAELRTCIEALPPGVDVALSPAATRGIGYYTGLTFEIHAAALPTSDTDICGGGRYAGLTRWIVERALQTRAIGENTPALHVPSAEALSGVGLAFGIDRIAAARLAEGNGATVERRGVYVAVQAAALLTDASRVAARLRPGVDVTVELPRREDELRPLTEQYGRASHRGARWVLLLADQEWSAGRVRLRDLLHESESELPLEGALQRVLESR